MKKTLEDTLNGVLNGMSTADIIRVWNEYCNKANCMDDYIYHNTPMFFEDNYCDGNLWELVKDIYYGSYNAAHDYVKFSQQTGHLVTFDHLSEDASPYDQSSLVSWLIRSYGYDLESIGDFIGVDLDDYIYTVGDKTYQYISDDECISCCANCCFDEGKTCGASDLFDAGVLPQCDEDGVGFRGYWIEVKDGE